MGCGQIAQRGPSVEVHHPLSRDPASRAAGARIVEGHHRGEGGHSNASFAAGVGGRQHGPDRHSAGDVHMERGGGGEGIVAPGVHPGGRARANDGLHGRGPPRRFVVGERVVLTSRLPSNIQDHAFCFECSAFFQLNTQRQPECSRCGSTFVQYLRVPGHQNWLVADSNVGVNFAFDDQLDNSITASLHETPSSKTPTQGAFLQSLRTFKLNDADIQLRSELDPADPRRNCSICREPFAEGDGLKALPCKHEFHGLCVVHWLSSNNTCPICRWKLPEASDADDVDEASDVPPKRSVSDEAPGRLDIAGHQ